jgi:hypothetical protein
MKEPINKITLKGGSVRYRLVVDVGRDESGRRKQLTRTFDTRREAREELSRIRHETNLGTYVKSSKETVNSYLDGYLKGQLAGSAPPPSGTMKTPCGLSASGWGHARSSRSPSPTSRT